MVKENETPTSDYQLHIERSVCQKLNAYVDAVDGEISGMAKSVIDIENQIITMVDIVIFDQTVTGTTTDLDKGATAKFVHDLMKRGEDLKDWSIWWHSHADMGTFWSQTDEDTVQGHNEQKFLISLVVNKKRHMLARLDIWVSEPNFGKKITLNETLEVFTLEEKDETIVEAVKKEVKKKVKEKTYQHQGGNQFNDMVWKNGKWVKNPKKKVKKGGKGGNVAEDLFNGRIFGVDSYDQDGFDVNGFHRLGNYNYNYDEFTDLSFD